MKRFKRIVGLALCLAMVLSFVPVSHTHTHVHAADSSDLERIDLSGSTVYLSSKEDSSSLDYADRTWLDSNAPLLVDGNTSNEEHARMWTGYRPDCYVDIGTAVSANQLQVHYTGYEESSDSRLDSNVPSITITLVLEDGSTKVNSYDTGWSGVETGSVTWTFDDTYEVKGIYIYSPDTPVDAYTHFSLAEIELYQDTSATGELGTTTVGTPGYKEITLTNDNLVGACSQNYAAVNVSTSTDFTGITWYFHANNKFSRIEGLVDDNTSPTGTTGYTKWGNGYSEGADFMLDLGSSGTAINQIKLYSYKSDSSYPTPKTFKVILLVKDGTPVEKTFSTGWADDVADGTVCIFDLGQTYTVTGVYVQSTTNTPTATSGNLNFSLAEVELYNKTSGQLPKPKNLQTTAITDNSITVAANTVSAGGKLQFSIDGGSTWKDANESSNNISNNSYTFTGLNAETTYTIQARYLATGDDYVTTATVASIEATTLEIQCNHTYDDCVDTTCNLNCGYVRTAPGHKYDSCDATVCNVCNKETREAGAHTYTNGCTDTTCAVCGATREAPGHKFDLAVNCDECVNCDYVKVNTSHVYDDTCADSDCNVCGATRVADHTYSNDCDTTCSECGYIRTDAGHVFSGDDGTVGTTDDACDTECDACGTIRKITHVYDSVCDDTCNNCGMLRDAPHSITDRCAANQTCSECGETFSAALHTYVDVCDDICNVCGAVADKTLGRVHTYLGVDGVKDTVDDACDTTCDRCGCVREAIHYYDSIYDADCNECGAKRDVLEEPTGLPSYSNASKETLTAPIFGYYSNKDTNGAITNWYVDGDGPDKLINGTTNDKADRAQSQHYNYVEIREGTKIPVILFNFSEAVNVCKMNIYGYQYNYYNIEDFDVQVYVDGTWRTVAQITNAFTDGTFQTDISKPLTVTFDKAYETTQLRILVNRITNMNGRGDGTSGNDIFGHKAPFRIREIEIYSTPVEVDQLTDITINGAHVSQYKIVYSADEPDYNLTAAEYIRDAIYKKTGYTLEILEDNASENECEILVGHTNRTLSQSVTAPANNVMKFNIQASGTKIAMEADYFIIAGAAYYFSQKYVPTASGQAVTVPETLQTLDPIIEAPNNYIMLIGDGMGVNQTKMFDVYNVPTSGNYAYSDGEDIFFGYYFPYQGRSRTWNALGQITDSAAGGSALSTGYKTTNGTVGQDRYGNEVQNLSELAMELGLAAGVMSTEGSDGATPASFSVHSDGRYDDDIPVKQATAEQNGMLFVDRYIDENTDVDRDELTADEWNTYEAKVKAGLNTLAADPDGFFLMYEEAHIDKNLHKGLAEETFIAMYRFNQAIGIFMEYAMYNPDTVVLITADHETGGIVLGDKDSEEVTFTTPNPPYNAQFSSKMNHSIQDVPVFAYGFGMEVFDTDVNDNGVYEENEYYENASIGRTYAHFMTNGHADNFDFGDPWYPILVKNTTPEVYPEDPLKIVATGTYDVLINDPEITAYSGNLVNGELKNNWEDEALYLNNGHHDTAGYICGINKDVTSGTPVARFVLKDGKARALAGVQLVSRNTDYITKFTVQVLDTNGAWQTVKTVAENPFASQGTVYLAFDQVIEGTAMQILVDDFYSPSTGLPMLQEINLFERKSGKALQQIDLSDSSLDANLTDGNLYTADSGIVISNPVSVPAVYEFSVTKADSSPTNIKKLIAHPYDEGLAPADTTVEAQVMINGEKVWVRIFEDIVINADEWKSGIMEFSESYDAYAIRVTVDSTSATTGTVGGGNLQFTEFELYGYSTTTPDLGGVVTSGGAEDGVTTIQLMRNGAEVYKTTTTDMYYHIMDVEPGKYTLIATKDGHITVEYDITVGTEPTRHDVELKYVSDSTLYGLSQCVRLIEPWAMRSIIQFGTDANNPVYLTSILGYGAYAVIEHKAGDTAPTTWQDIVYNEKAIKFEKSYTAGDELISHTTVDGSNRRYTVMYDFYDMLYTYRMAENVYWVVYYEDAAGIHFTKVDHESLSGLIDTIKEEGNAPDNEVAVLDDMKALHKSLIDYRGADADIGNTDYPEPITLKDSGLKYEDFTTGSYMYGRRHQIRLIEPWGFKVTLRVKPTGSDEILDPNSAEVQDVGMIFYHDKVNEYYNSGMGSKDILEREDAVVFSKAQGNLFVTEDDAVLAVYDKGIYTYQLDTELYCLPFVKINGQYYCQKTATRWNIRDEMTTFRDDETRDILERDVFEDMVNLYYDVRAYLGY